MNKPAQIELLAPARNLQTGIEAIACGADAVYIGAEAFGARHAAGNSVDDIAQLAEYAHAYGAKVYVTINTILYDQELEQVRSLAGRLHDAGVDALITQDTALLQMDLPLPLHASTQMDNRTIDDAKRLEQWGFKQIVLARELGLSQIAKIHEACPQLKLEAFVHGALCVSYSGKCYASEYCFKRSANRGECAQFCRLAFDLEDSNGRTLLRNKHLLSLKDMNRSAHLEEMLDAGVTSFKIEGRLKDIGYVKNVTAHYSALLDGIVKRRAGDYCRASKGKCHTDFEPNVAKSFNRGFTDYFLHGRTEDIASISTPKSKGEPVGYVKEIRNGYILVGGICSFHNGDGLCFYNDKGELEGFRINRVENNKLYPHRIPSTLRVKTPLFRNLDAEFESLLQKPSPRRTLLADITLEETPCGFRLTARDELQRTATLEFEYPKETARSPQQERIKKELLKLGDTIFFAKDIRMEVKEDYFIPASILSKWRRALVEKLQDCKIPEESERAADKKGASSSQACKVAPLLGYAANVSNRAARDFYTKNGAREIAPAFEIQPPASPATLMTCRHCVRYSLGQCLKHKPGQPASIVKGRLPEKLYLSLPDGRRFSLYFNCSRCEMSVKSCDTSPKP